MNDDPIADYLAELNRALRGRPGRERLVAEAEDHLRDSEEYLQERGHPPEEAAALAVQRMGPIQPFARAAGGWIATAIVVGIGATIGIALLASASATSGPGGDSRAPGFPMYLFIAGLGVLIVTVAAVCTVRSWASPVATTASTVRLGILTLALIAAVGMGELAVHEGKHQNGGSLATREQRALMCLAIGAGIVALTVWVLELHARRTG